jgi:hypothetical protein
VFLGVINIALMRTKDLRLDGTGLDEATASNLSFEHFLCVFFLLLENNPSLTILLTVNLRLETFLEISSKEFLIEYIVDGIVLEYCHSFSDNLEVFQ